MKELYLIWHSYISEEYILIGYLRKIDNEYFFEYNIEEALRAQEEGCFLPFNLDNKIHKDTNLFPFFKDRVMNMDRPSIAKYLKDSKIDEYDEFKLLSIMGGIKNTDNFLVIRPEQYKRLQFIQRKSLNNFTRR